MITTYAKVVGGFLFSLGGLGLFASHHVLPEFLRFEPLVSIVFLSTGLMLLFAGFSGQWNQTRKTVLFSAAIYALLAMTGFITNPTSLEYSSNELLCLSLSVSALMFGLPEAYSFKH
jgi:hypothetical protein